MISKPTDGVAVVGAGRFDMCGNDQLNAIFGAVGLTQLNLIAAALVSVKGRIDIRGVADHVSAGLLF